MAPLPILKLPWGGSGGLMSRYGAFFGSRTVILPPKSCCSAFFRSRTVRHHHCCPQVLQQRFLWFQNSTFLQTMHVTVCAEPACECYLHAVLFKSF